MLPFPRKMVIDHGGHGRAFNNRVASEFRIIIGLRRVRPLVDVKMLVLQRMGKFVRHDHALVGGRIPIGNEKLLAVRIIESGNLLGEHLHQRLFERIVLRKQSEFLHGFLIGVAFVRRPCPLSFSAGGRLEFLPGSAYFFSAEKGSAGKAACSFRQGLRRPPGEIPRSARSRAEAEDAGGAACCAATAHTA